MRVVITGAAGVLGAAVAKAFLSAGASIALMDRAAASQDPLKGVPGTHVFLDGIDLTDLSQARGAMETAASQLGGIDVLINIAGGFRWETLEAGSWEIWHAMFRMNVLTATNASRAAIAHLKRSASGRIVNVGANGALKAAMGMGAYAASKAGVHKLTESLAEELKADGVTVNAVLPSIIDTPANRADMPKADPSAWVAPADLAAVMLFLASEQARAVTGALLPVTGRV